MLVLQFIIKKAKKKLFLTNFGWELVTLVNFFAECCALGDA